MRAIRLALLLVLCLAGARAFAATQTFTFDLSGNGIAGTGTLTAEAIGDGKYFLTGISGTINGEALGMLQNTVIGPSVPGSAPLYLDDRYAYTDLIYTNPLYGQSGQAGTLLDEGGLGLTYGGKAVNLLGSGSAAQGYLFIDANATPRLALAVSFSVAAVPEPSGYLLLLTGLVLAGWKTGGRRRMTRYARHIVKAPGVAALRL